MMCVHSNVCAGWTKLGDGGCMSAHAELHYQLNDDWIIANLTVAKKACEASAFCVGIHYDTGTAVPGDYLLLSKLGTPTKIDPGKRTCYKLRANPGTCALPGACVCLTTCMLHL